MEHPGAEQEGGREAEGKVDKGMEQVPKKVHKQIWAKALPSSPFKKHKMKKSGGSTKGATGVEQSTFLNKNEWKSSEAV